MAEMPSVLAARRIADKRAAASEPGGEAGTIVSNRPVPAAAIASRALFRVRVMIRRASSAGCGGYRRGRAEAD